MAKRKRRDMNPANSHNWALVCSFCGAQFSDDETIDLTNGHIQQEHPDEEMVHLNTIWVGIGPTPKKRPQRRRRR